MPAKDPRSYDERFWSKVDKAGPIIRLELGPCWIWMAGLTDKGYGLFKNRGYREYRAHRIAWALVRGAPAGDGVLLCHRCDNRPCVRPDHLFPGTNADNQQDSIAKGRKARGEASGHNRLTESDVIDIRTLVPIGASVRSFAEAFDVDMETVRDALTRRTWRHVA